MSNFIVYADDIKGKHVNFRENGVSFDRLICDIPSFEGRYPGTATKGEMMDGVNSVIDLMKFCITKTATISVTGEAQEKFDAWLASQSDWEMIPNSEWCMFQPYYRNATTNKHFWGRKDEWTYVRSFRRVGSDVLIAWSNFQGVPFVSGAGENFPMPAARVDIEISAFRLPVHKGADESKEHQKWLQKHGIQYTETYIEGRHGDKITAVSDPGRIFDGGSIIAPSDFNLYKHIPHRLYNQGNINSGVIEQFDNPAHLGLTKIQGTDHVGVPFYNFLLQTHTKPGDRILDPFCGTGAMGVAARLLGRNFVGVEFNADRARGAQLAIEEIDNYLTR
jgi:hypothetical protein